MDYLNEFEFSMDYDVFVELLFKYLLINSFLGSSAIAIASKSFQL